MPFSSKFCFNNYCFDALTDVIKWDIFIFSIYHIYWDATLQQHMSLLHSLDFNIALKISSITLALYLYDAYATKAWSATKSMPWHTFLYISNVAFRLKLHFTTTPWRVNVPLCTLRWATYVPTALALYFDITMLFMLTPRQVFDTSSSECRNFDLYAIHHNDDAFTDTE